jgi:hypothetical protein
MRVITLLLPTILFAGCLQSTTVVKINGDGSGTLENQTLMTAAALNEIRQLSGLLGSADAKPFDPFSEEQARTLAAQMGDGVALLSSRPLKTAAGEGRASVFGFRDITALRVSRLPAAAGSQAGRLGGVGGDPGDLVTIDLTRTAAGTALLTLHMPADPLSSMFSQLGSLSRRDGPVSVDQPGMMRQMLSGMHVALRVEPSGRLVRTTSPFVDGQTVTLFDVQLDPLLKDEETFARLQTARSAQDVAEVLKNVPGLKLPVERDIVIEFAP